MGKAAILLTIAAVITGTTLLFQANQTGVRTDYRQSERQAQIIAREIARTGQNLLLTKARQLQRANPDSSLAGIVNLTNGPNGFVQGTYKGGAYTAELKLTSSSTFSATAVGSYDLKDHKVESERLETSPILEEGILEVLQPSNLSVTFLQSMAGYCSAIYLQRIPAGYQAGDPLPTPETIFTPGHNRDGSSVQPSSIILDPGTRMNFIMAVDSDFSCEKEGQDIPISDPMFDYSRNALVSDVVDLNTMTEGPYAMIQENPNRAGVWRIAFEDLFFSDAKLLDTKANGYGSTKWNKKKKTYGGSGWSQTDGLGYWMLNDYGGKPDFSDQVIEIELLPVSNHHS